MNRILRQRNFKGAFIFLEGGLDKGLRVGSQTIKLPPVKKGGVYFQFPSFLGDSMLFSYLEVGRVNVVQFQGTVYLSFFVWCHGIIFYRISPF